MVGAQQVETRLQICLRRLQRSVGLEGPRTRFSSARRFRCPGYLRRTGPRPDVAQSTLVASVTRPAPAPSRGATSPKLLSSRLDISRVVGNAATAGWPTKRLRLQTLDWCYRATWWTSADSRRPRAHRRPTGFSAESDMGGNASFQPRLLTVLDSLRPVHIAHLELAQAAMPRLHESPIRYKSVADFVREVRIDYRNKQPAVSWEETLKELKEAAGVNVFGPNDPLEEREQHRAARAWIQHVSAVFKVYIDHPEHTEDAPHLERFSKEVVWAASAMLEYLFDVMVQSGEGGWAVEWRHREILEQFLLVSLESDLQ